MFRKKSIAKLFNGNSPSSPKSPEQVSPPLPPKDARYSPYLSSPAPEQQQRYTVDDFGRPLDRPAFAKDSEAGAMPFGAGHGVGDDREAGELQLLFGYAPLETQVELDITRCNEVVQHVSKELRARGELFGDALSQAVSAPKGPFELTLVSTGLDTPLILSSLSLDISLEGSCSLVRSYLADEKQWAAGEYIPRRAAEKD